MRNLLAANFYRLRKSSAFWLALAATLAYTGLIVLVCWDHCADGTGNYTLEAILTAGFGLMGYLCIPSLILAPLLAVYLGTEHSEHTVRNKLITGHSKAGVYLAELAVCILTALTLDILFMLLAGLLPPVGNFFASLPESVLGGCTIMMFGSIVISGMQMIANCGFSQRNVTIASLSLAIGIGFTASSEADIWNIFPDTIRSVFSSNVVAVVFVVSIILSLVLPKDMDIKKVVSED